MENSEAIALFKSRMKPDEGTFSVCVTNGRARSANTYHKIQSTQSTKPVSNNIDILDRFIFVDLIEYIINEEKTKLQ